MSLRRGFAARRLLPFRGRGGVAAAKLRWVGFVIAVLLAPAVAAAEPAAPSLASMLCPPEAGHQPLDARRLVRHLLDQRGVPDAVLDADRDGDTLFVEKRRALLDPAYCAAGAGACPAEAAAALADLRSRLEAVLDDPRIEVERVRRPGPLERAADPLLASADDEAGTVTAAEVLDPEDRFVRLSCRPPSALEVAEAEVEAPQWVRDPDADEGFRLTSEIDDLSKRRIELGTVKPAEFSISANLLDDRTTFFVDAVGGYHFEVGRGDAVRVLSVPFALIERRFTDEQDEIDKLGLGWQGSASLPLGGGAEQEFALTPVYLTDRNFESDIGSLKVRWTPALASESGVPLGNVQRYGALLVSTGIDLLGEAGSVFDSGDSADLLSENRFFRVGGRLRLSLRGTPGTLLERIQFDLSDKYLYNVNGAIEHINLAEVALSYLFPEVENYRLTFGFTGGRDEDTLVEKAFWRTQIGVRF